MERLRPFNIAAGVAHLLQAVAILVLSTDFTLPVSTMYASGPPGQPPSGDRVEELFSYPLGPAVALFSLLSAFFHWIVFQAAGIPAPIPLALWVGFVSQFLFGELFLAQVMPKYHAIVDQ